MRVLEVFRVGDFLVLSFNFWVVLGYKFNFFEFVKMEIVMLFGEGVDGNLWLECKGRG